MLFRAEMRIPSEDAPVIIGRRGENIKDIQRRTNTTMHFKDEREILTFLC